MEKSLFKLIIVIIFWSDANCQNFDANIIINHSNVVQQLKARALQSRKIPANSKKNKQDTSQSLAYLSIPALKNMAFDRFGLNDNPSLKLLVDKIIKKEKELSENYYVFYHGQQFHFRIFQDVLKSLMKAIEIRGVLGDFVYLRAPTIVFNKFNSANHFLDFCDEKYGIYAWNNYTDDIPKDLLSVNLSLFGNTSVHQCCSFYYFINSYNWTIFQLQNITEDFFDYYKLNKKYIRDLIDLYEMFKTKEGNLLQIFIPKNKVDNCAYLSLPYGRPYTDVIVKDCYDDNKKRHSKIAPILDLYCKTPHLISHLDELETRLLLTSDVLLNPDSGVKIFRYTTMKKEQKVKYKIELQKILKKLISDWINAHQNIKTTYPLGKLSHYIWKYKSQD